MRSRQQTLLAVAAILAAGVAVYANSFDGVYVCDDVGSIAHNDTICKIWPDSFKPPIDSTESGRPLLNVSFALNYAVGGTNRFGYHVVNLIIHLCCALLLFSLVRLTLDSPRMKDRFGRVSWAIAAATALIWVVHPLQTQAVTYIVQRGESLAALFYLLTIYCGARGMESGRLRWYLASAAACAIGATDKETLVSAPLVMAAYDWLFMPGALRWKITSRGWFYLALAASWGILYALLKAYPMSGRQHEEALPSALQYALWQPWTILHYLKLAFWPDPLFILYRSLWPLPPWQTVVGIVVILPLVALTAWGLIRRRPEAFLGVWLFGILSPTSSFYPLGDVIMDHRMYLPLAAVVAGVVIAFWRLAPKQPVEKGRSSWHGRLGHVSHGRPARGLQGRDAPATHGQDAHATFSTGCKVAPHASGFLCGSLLTVCVVALGATAVARNDLYGDGIKFWEQNLRYTPNSPNVYLALADTLRRAKRYDEAIEDYHRVLEMNPHFLDAYINLGVSLTQTNHPQEALHYLEVATQAAPESVDAAFYLGDALEALGRLDDALVQYTRAIKLAPRHYICCNRMGSILLQLGRPGEAVECFRKGLEVAPRMPQLHNNLAIAYRRLSDFKAAEAESRIAVELNPNDTPTANNLREIQELLRNKQPASSQPG